MGSSINIQNRKREHFDKLKNNIHNNRHLQKAFNKYGKNNFSFEVLEYVEDKYNLIEREQYWMDEYQVSNRELGYNIGPTAGSCLGVKFNNEAKLNVSISHKGICAGEKHPMFGKHHSEETKQKMKASNSKENNKFYGKKHSEETKRKMSTRKGKYIGEKCHLAKLNEQQVREIKLLLLEGKYTQKQIAKMYNIGATQISYIKKGKSWSHVKLEGTSKKDFENIFTKTKLNEEKVIEIKKLISKSISLKEIAESFKVSEGYIRKIKNGKTWYTVELDNISNDELKNIINEKYQGKLSNKDMLEINKLLNEGVYESSIAEKYKVSQSTISRYKLKYNNIGELQHV